jgi:hypothetical protein
MVDHRSLKYGALRCVLVIALGLVGPASTCGDVLPTRPERVTPDTEAAIDRGLQYLARTQTREGAWRHAGNMGQYPVAMTALAALAFLGNGNTATQGRYAPQVSRAADYILANANPSGLIASVDDRSRSMYGHGFSMLFLGQLLGVEDDIRKQERIRDVLQAAVDLTARSQSELGGWIYTPDSRGDEGSVTITQLQGLRSCRNAGIAVPKPVIDGALRYLDMSALPDGGIAYRADRRGQSRPPITAAAVACWYNAGQYDHPLALKALEYIKERIGNGASRLDTWGHYYYAHFYMAQVMWLTGEEDWAWYYPEMRDLLLATQEADGSWIGDQVGKTYGTAIAVVILQMPYRYLPILQR